MDSTSFRPAPAAPSSGQPGRRPLHLVDFIYRAPLAKSVSLVGDFNQWDPNAHPMTRMPDGGWIIRLELPHGHHQYQFIVDGKPMLDPNAMGKVHNERNEEVSLIAIS
ncbi:MAG TPA: isoamylase early set domain-containing protein [Candidatus Paceibacterota bacterium]|nr:isoamylase early set domain-containing protein [Verrucomicrobiota bacterium]HSA11809.1 isoamylase early set domain-containing protein [Candidatus Paceibacterota bacterium]